MGEEERLLVCRICGDVLPDADEWVEDPVCDNCLELEGGIKSIRPRRTLRYLKPRRRITGLRPKKK